MRISLLVQTAVLAVIIVTVLIALIIIYQEKLIFHPNAAAGFEEDCRTPDRNPAGFQNPAEYGLKFENVTVHSTDGVKLHMWLVKTATDSATRPTVLYFQGNAGNMGFRLPNLAQMVKHAKVNVAALSYRGYGWSTGIPSEKGFIDDATAALKHLRERSDIDPTKLVLFGRSIGGAVAIQTGAKNLDMIRAVVAENTFLNIAEMAFSIFPFFRAVPRFVFEVLLRVKLDSAHWVARINKPIMFIAGTEDEIVPPVQMKELWNCINSNTTRRWVAITGGHHNDSWQMYPQEYYRILREFIEDVCSNERASKMTRTETLSLGEEDGKQKTKKQTPEEAVAHAPVRAPRFYESAIRQVYEEPRPARSAEL